MRYQYSVIWLIVGIIVVAIGGYYLSTLKPPTQPAAMTNSDLLNAGDMQVLGNDIMYYQDVKGYYVRPIEEGSHPGVVMIHEWWGPNKEMREAAEDLASRGYQVLAVDLFGRVATTREEARAHVAALDQAAAIQNLTGAVGYLRGQGAGKVASLGWCFGGGQAFQLSTSGEKLDATVIYYGQVSADANQLEKISWPVLGIFGEEDRSIPTDNVEAFRSALTTLDIENSIHIYPGVGHAFANPSGDTYAPAETADAWMRTVSFLDANLKR